MIDEIKLLENHNIAKLSQASASALAEISFNFPHPPCHPGMYGLAGNEMKSLIKG